MVPSSVIQVWRPRSTVVTKAEIADWPKTTTQPGDQLRSIFTSMGASVSFSDAGLTLKGTGTIHGIDIDLHDVGEVDHPVE